MSKLNIDQKNIKDLFTERKADFEKDDLFEQRSTIIVYYYSKD